MLIKKIKLPGVIYEMTTLCNLNCKYCYNYWKKNNENLAGVESFNPLKTLKQFIKNVKCKEVTFSGGEPTTNFKELLDCIMYLKARNYKVTIITNATLLDSENVDILAKLKVDLLEITINSYKKEIHERLNGIEGSFEKSIQIIKEAKKKGIEVVVPIVLTKYNVKEIDKTLNLIYNELGVSRIMINRYNIGGYGCNKIEEIVPKIEELKEAFSLSQEFASKNDIKLYSLVCTPHCVLNPEEYPDIVFSNCSFENLNRRYTLTRDGNVRYCNHSPEILGNIYTSSMNTILKSELLKKWSISEPKFCSGCDKKKQCQYGCRAASQQIGRGLEREDPIIEIYNVKAFDKR